MLYSIIFGLCLFIALLSFKPSEPYLSEFLICNHDTQEQWCATQSDSAACQNQQQCTWSKGSCCLTACKNLNSSDCGNNNDDATDYCHIDGNGKCQDMKCYKDFTADQVNNEIYPWSTYAYLPFLLTLGPIAEIITYRSAIIIGVSGILL